MRDRRVLYVVSELSVLRNIGPWMAQTPHAVTTPLSLPSDQAAKGPFDLVVIASQISRRRHESWIEKIVKPYLRPDAEVIYL